MSVDGEVGIGVELTEGSAAEVLGAPNDPLFPELAALVPED